MKDFKCCYNDNTVDGVSTSPLKCTQTVSLLFLDANAMMDAYYLGFIIQHPKKSLIFKFYFSEELISLTVLLWILASYLRITKPEC